MQDAIILYENGKAIGGEGHPTDADDITFNNAGTDIVADKVGSAIKEVNANSAKSADLTPNNETGSTASRAYKLGDLIYIRGTLYRAATDIASGATFTENTNIFSVKLNDIVPFKMIYDGNVTFTSGLGTINISGSEGKVYPLVARCIGANAPCMVSLDPYSSNIQVLLPISLGYSGALRTAVYGVDLR